MSQEHMLLASEREYFFLDIFNEKDYFHSFCPHMQDAMC